MGSDASLGGTLQNLAAHDTRSGPWGTGNFDASLGGTLQNLATHDTRSGPWGTRNLDASRSSVFEHLAAHDTRLGPMGTHNLLDGRCRGDHGRTWTGDSLALDSLALRSLVGTGRLPSSGADAAM